MANRSPVAGSGPWPPPSSERLSCIVATVAVPHRMRTPDDDGVSSELWKCASSWPTRRTARCRSAVGRRTWRPRASETGWLHVEFFTRAPLALDVDGIPVAVSAPTGDGWAVSPDAPDLRGALPRRVYAGADLAPGRRTSTRTWTSCACRRAGRCTWRAWGVRRPCRRLRRNCRRATAGRGAAGGRPTRAGHFYYESHTYARHGDWAMDCAMPSASLAPSAADVGSALDALGAEHAPRLV